ncbi:MAG: hypothetical protein EOM68_13380 [Spirochaetia bacterium]|nr:hypothetical protein [Spirochaetia bacterium]
MMYRGINKTLLDQQYYNTVVGEYEIAATAHTALGDMIPPIVREGLTGGSPVTDAKEKAAVDKQVALISTAIIDALNEAWIEEQALMVTSDVVGLLNAEKATLTAVIDLKGKLSEIEKNIASGLEKLSDAELFAMFGAPRAYIPVIAQQIVGKLGLPESLVLADLVDESAPGILEMVLGHLGTMDSLFGILAWLVIIVFLVLCLLSWKVGGGLQWFGVSAALTGALFLSLISYMSNFKTIENLAGADLKSLPIDSSTLQNIIGFTFSEMKLMPILFLVGGIVLFSLGLVVRKGDR